MPPVRPLPQRRPPPVSTPQNSPLQRGLRWPALWTGAAGLLLATGQAPLSLPWLAVVGLAAGIWLISSAGAPRAMAWRGWLLGTVYFAACLPWIVEPFFVDAARHGWMAPFALVGLAAGLALFWGLACGCAGWLGRRSSGAGRPVLVALGLVAAEAARAHLFTGFPWASIGHIWIGAPQAQLAALTGAGGLTLITCLAAALPAALGAQRAPLGAMLGAALLAIPAAWGMVRVGLLASDAQADAPVIRLIQPNAPQHQKWDRDHIRTFYQRGLALSSAPPTGAQPALVVWPETSVPIPLSRADATLQEIAQAAQAPVAAGILRRSDEDGLARNSLVLVGPDGDIQAVYDKHHLVPFGEYIPFASALNAMGLYGLAEAAGGYGAGPGPRVLDFGPELGLGLPLICYEAVFGPELRAAPERARFILQITNDAWFGRWMGPQQHLAQAQLRAIEQGLPVLRAANTGVSAVIDATGQVISRLPMGGAGHLDAPLPAGLERTPYDRWGGLPVGVIWVLCIVGTLTFLRDPS